MTRPLVLACLVTLAAVSAPSCGGSQTSRAATINSLYSGLNAAARSLRTYEGVQADAVIARVKASTETVDQARADLIALRAKVHPVEVARDAAYSAIDVALTVNDDPSLAGAQLALNRAIAAITALTGGK